MTKMRKIESYKKAVEYLESFIRPTVFQRIEEDSKLPNPLERMRIMLGLFGNPQNKFKSIVVSGTSGKGSTAYLVSHILVQSGYKTGLTISPHLEKLNERIQINEKKINDREFVRLLNRVVPVIEVMKAKGDEPSYFEILIAMTFLYFAKEKIDIAIVEVGLEGKYDATNVLDPLIFVLTNISLDHTAILGNTIQNIAKEAIFRIKNYELGIKKMPVVVSGVKQSSVIKIVEKRCKEAGSDLFLLGRDFKYEIKEEGFLGSIFNFSHSAKSEIRSTKLETNLNDQNPNGKNLLNLENSNFNIVSDFGIRYSNLFLALLGEYQVENAALAIETLIKLGEFGFKITEKNIREALNTAFFPGRFEVINHRTKQNNTQNNSEISHLSTFNYQLVLDGAHNPTKMQAFIRALRKFRASTPGVEVGEQNQAEGKGKVIFVVAFKKDKNIKSMLREILSAADTLIITQFDVKTDLMKQASMEISNIKYQISNIKSKRKNRIYTEKDSKKAVQKAISVSSEHDLIVITGSLYLVGEIRSLFK